MKVSILVLGESVSESAKSAAQIEGVSKVFSIDDSNLKNKIAETHAAVLQSVISKGAFTHVLSSSSNHGKNFLFRTAALAGASPLSDAISVIDNETFQRPMYAGNAISTIKMTDTIKFLTIRPTAFEKAGNKAGAPAPIESIPFNPEHMIPSVPKFVSVNETKSERPDLNTARVVVSGGRGMKSGENFAMLEKLADKLGGAVGASRAAVDAGFVPNDYQVGQTGKVVAPDLYIAVMIMRIYNMLAYLVSISMIF